jgi:acetyl-CoA C-acetyltransferase
MQNMSAIPISSAMTVAEQFGFTSPTNESKNWLERYGDQEISQFRGSELIAEKWDLSREDMEKYALRSHERPSRRSRPGISTTRSSPSRPRRPSGSTRPAESSLEKMAGLKPWSRAVG